MLDASDLVEAIIAYWKIHLLSANEHHLDVANDRFQKKNVEFFRNKRNAKLVFSRQQARTQLYTSSRRLYFYVSPIIIDSILCVF